MASWVDEIKRRIDAGEGKYGTIQDYLDGHLYPIYPDFFDEWDDEEQLSDDP